MKVKVGDMVYDGAVEPVMVILTDKDKENISSMSEHHHKYTSFPKGLSDNEVERFMEIKEATNRAG